MMNLKPMICMAFLLCGTAAAQTYDPTKGESPLTLLAVPKDGVAYYETKVRARALVESEKLVEAEPLAEQLARDYPRDPENWMLLGRIKWGLKKYAEATAAYEKAGPLIGWDIEYQHGYLMAAGYMRTGNRRAALDMLRKMIFEQHGFSRAELLDWPSFEPLKNDPEFLELIGHPDPAGWTREE